MLVTTLMSPSASLNALIMRVVALMMMMMIGMVMVMKLMVMVLVISDVLQWLSYARPRRTISTIIWTSSDKHKTIAEHQLWYIYMYGQVS